MFTRLCVVPSNGLFIRATDWIYRRSMSRLTRVQIDSILPNATEHVKQIDVESLGWLRTCKFSSPCFTNVRVGIHNLPFNLILSTSTKVSIRVHSIYPCGVLRTRTESLKHFVRFWTFCQEYHQRSPSLIRLDLLVFLGTLGA